MHTRHILKWKSNYRDWVLLIAFFSSKMLFGVRRGLLMSTSFLLFLEPKYRYQVWICYHYQELEENMATLVSRIFWDLNNTLWQRASFWFIQELVLSQWSPEEEVFWIVTLLKHVFCALTPLTSSYLLKIVTFLSIYCFLISSIYLCYFRV